MMKSLVRRLQTLSSSSSSSSRRRSLTADEVAQINLLLPRLCLSSDRRHLATATKLATAALLTNPPPNSLSLSPLLLSLASLPSSDTSLPMSLLTRLRHSHSPHLLPSATALAASYFRAAHPKLAFKLFNWVVRPGSNVVVDRRLCAVLVGGFCRNGMVLESLKVLRAFVSSNDGAPRGGGELGRLVCRGLLREARVWEAAELSQALDGRDEVSQVLDRIIENWTE
ncbi:hypothetical protein TIFTF001_018724 [Ficus carica]|uniref:Pentatricopeptide repeat-containing protein n=1 Tax=Ficus carica TaxID=3494 RepID=A0AA88ABZ5_FICCA|nr:hypothetical protein TIFTF001_018724 [Ficus carica]